MHQTIFLIGVLIFSAHLFTAVSERTKIPDVLLLMIVGIVVGPILGIVGSNYFGEFGFVITTIALIVILFDGGTHLRIESLKTGFGNTVFLSLLTFVLTLGIVAVTCYYIFELNVITSLMIGAILSPISPAVVLPMISSLKMEPQGKTILVLETAITDVLAIILAFSFIQSAQSGKVEVTYIISQISSSTIIALIIGLLGGVAWSQLLSKVRQFPNSIFTTFAAIFILYGFAEMFHFSGALTALAFGFAISNLSTLNLKKSKWLRKIEKEDFIEKENTFFSEIQFLLKIFFFVFLGISFPLDQLVYLGWGLGITLLLFIARLLVAKFTLPATLSSKSSAIATIMIPKGLASAVLAGIPLQRQMMHGDVVQNIVYAVILWSILLTSVFVILVERTSFQSFILRMIGKKIDEETLEDEEKEPETTPSN
jgi:NhaP-type Na+/H+ or K+/H+ antiporter